MKKITKAKLKQIIKEERDIVLSELGYNKRDPIEDFGNTGRGDTTIDDYEDQIKEMLTHLIQNGEQIEDIKAMLGDIMMMLNLGKLGRGPE
tara:strand:- start:297 stop:569 length:273 start_codon:yes stop_codon:yes gene_type:complete